MPFKPSHALIALAVILAIGLGLHLYRVSYPDRPVFDEAHFATYAADYVKDRVFFDIHPPLGKLIYAAFIRSSIRNLWAIRPSSHLPKTRPARFTIRRISRSARSPTCRSGSSAFSSACCSPPRFIFSCAMSASAKSARCSAHFS